MFLYLVTEPVPRDLLRFLERHARLLRALPKWTLRLLIPRHLAAGCDRYQGYVRDALGSLLSPKALEELRWYFEQRRNVSLSDAQTLTNARFRRAAAAFASRRFQELYQRWLTAGDEVLEELSSSVLSEAFARGSGTLECLILPHGYYHLGSIAGTA